MGVDEEVRQLAMRRIEPRIERWAIDAVGVGQRGALGLQRPDVEVDLRFGGQLGAIELRLHPRRACFAPRQLRGSGSVAGVVPAVTAGLDAEAGGELRVELHPFGEFGVEEGGEPGVFAGGGNAACGGCGGGGRRQHERRDDGRHADFESAFHGFPCGVTGCLSGSV